MQHSTWNSQVILLLSLLMTFSLGATEPPPLLEPVPDGAPELKTPDDPNALPEVTIVRRVEGTIEEYRLHGRLYMVRVIPKRGFPYFLVDSDGDGSLDQRFNDLDTGLAIPAWVILQW